VNEPEVNEITRFAAPYRREIVLQDVLHESGLRLLRMRIREGHRFTIIDLDGPTTEDLAMAMLSWREKTGPASNGPGDGDGEGSE